MKIVRLTAAGAIALAACTGGGSARTTPPPSPTPAAPARTPARAVPSATAASIVRDATGRQVGALNFADTYAGVLITGTVSDLGLGAHGFHLHAVGKCEVPFTSAGGHFNPTGRQHGYLNPNGSHLGDLPNLELPAAGARRFELLVPGVSLVGPHGLLDADGASIVIHAARDDYRTDPAGDSGGRIACGVIVAK